MERTLPSYTQKTWEYHTSTTLRQIVFTKGIFLKRNIKKQNKICLILLQGHVMSAWWLSIVDWQDLTFLHLLLRQEGKRFLRVLNLLELKSNWKRQHQRLYLTYFVSFSLPNNGFFFMMINKGCCILFSYLYLEIISRYCYSINLSDFNKDIWGQFTFKNWFNLT